MRFASTTPSPPESSARDGGSTDHAAIRPHPDCRASIAGVTPQPRQGQRPNRNRTEVAHRRKDSRSLDSPWSEPAQGCRVLANLKAQLSQGSDDSECAEELRQRAKRIPVHVSFSAVLRTRGSAAAHGHRDRSVTHVGRRNSTKSSGGRVGRQLQPLSGGFAPPFGPQAAAHAEVARVGGRWPEAEPLSHLVQRGG